MVSVGQSVLSSVLIIDWTVHCPGVGFLFGLFISPLLTRTENNRHSLQDQLWSWSGQDFDQAEAQDDPPFAAEKAKVLCWIMTGPETHQTKVIILRILRIHYLDFQ